LSAVLFFGAGASFGNPDCSPEPPPLGARLFDELQAQGPTAASIEPEMAALFRKDFEGGMLAFYQARPGVGQTVRRTIDASGNIVERTLDTTGKVVKDTTVARLLNLPVINQTTNANGQQVRLVRDTTGAVIEYTLDNTGKIASSRIVSKAPPAPKKP
jgi:hypothetical protein